MENALANKPLRWATLIVILVNIAFNYLYMYIMPDAPDMATVTHQYNSLFVPADYAFSIWGLIYLSFVVYAVWQLLPAQQYKQVYDQLDVPLIIANLLALTWTYVFRLNMILLSVVIILVTLLCALTMFARAHRAVNAGFSKWLLVPFSLFAGWLSVATISNISLWLVSIGWDGWGLSNEMWAIIMLAVALLFAAMATFSSRDFIYPLVVAWATFAIWIALESREPLVAQCALGVAICSVIFAVVAIARNTKYERKLVPQVRSI